MEYARSQGDMCDRRPACSPAQSAAVSVIPGVVFSGAVNGHFRAYSTKTGEILWDFDTAKPFETVNKVPGKGGSINGGGAAIANGMVFTNSGYGFVRPDGRQRPARVFGRREVALGAGHGRPIRRTFDSWNA